MRRALLLSLGVAFFTWLEFQFYPGHTYLRSRTQIYLPILERLDTPGFLSRDLVAIHPHVTYTIYDEITLFLHEIAGLSFKIALLSQQLLFRAAAMAGVVLIARATGIGRLFSLLIAVFFSLGAVLVGPSILVIAREPIPNTFAFCLVILAIGLLAYDKPLLSGIVGGLALVYQPVITLPFWLVLFTSWIADKGLRPLIRPSVTVAIIFILLLANFAQLQPGITEPQVLFGKMSQSWAAIQHYRTSFAWVSTWAGHDTWNYAALWVIEIWATTRIWPLLNRQMRWLFIAMPICGLISVPFAYLSLNWLHWSLIPQIQPARLLAYTVAFATIACGLAAAWAMRHKKFWESGLWWAALFAIAIRGGILNLLHVKGWTGIAGVLLALFFSAGLVLSEKLPGVKSEGAALAVAAVTIFIMSYYANPADPLKNDEQPVCQLALWAERNTWGSSMFLFPDAGRGLYPGLFRAESRRPLWVDWESGEQVLYFSSFAEEWFRRWRETMEGSFTRQRLRDFLSLPIDYYVVKRAHSLAGLKPVYENTEFVVYDAQDLRNSSIFRAGIKR